MRTIHLPHECNMDIFGPQISIKDVSGKWIAKILKGCICHILTL